MHMQPVLADVSVGKTPGPTAQDTVYRLDMVLLDAVIEFRQDPIDPSTFRRYINGVRR